MKIIIETIPHETQRYTTVGDWFYGPDGTLHIKVSALSDPRYEQLIAIHELCEVLLCANDGVTQEAVDQFDFNFEKDVPEDEKTEPGDSPQAPYQRQHCFATAVERMMAAEMRVQWTHYEEELCALPVVEPKG